MPQASQPIKKREDSGEQQCDPRPNFQKVN